MTAIHITARTKGIEYTPLLCDPLPKFSFDNLCEVLNSKTSSFILEFNKDEKFAVSRWSSPKRARTYPYTRVYNTLGL